MEKTVWFPYDMGIDKYIRVNYPYQSTKTEVQRIY